MPALPNLTPPAFDQLARPDRRIVGVDAIGAVLGVSGRTIRRWADDPESGLPVHRLGGRWVGYKSELVAWERANRA